LKTYVIKSIAKNSLYNILQKCDCGVENGTLLTMVM